MAASAAFPNGVWRLRSTATKNTRALVDVMVVVDVLVLLVADMVVAEGITDVVFLAVLTKGIEEVVAVE